MELPVLSDTFMNLLVLGLTPKNVDRAAHE